MEATLKLDYRAFDTAFAQFAKNSRKSGAAVLRSQARLFVRDVVSITPPNKNARLRPAVGKMMVTRDIKRAVKNSRAKGIPTAEQVHQKARNRRGKVPASTIAQKGSGRAAYIKKMVERVGLLASGWNAAALKFKCSARDVPKWITRHGTGRGMAVEVSTRKGFLIRITNAVRFAGMVMGMQRRMQWALDNRAIQMDKQLEDQAIKRAAKAAGLKTS